MLGRLLRDPMVAIFVGVSITSGFASTAMSLVAGVWILSLTGSSSLAALAGLCVYLPTLTGPVLGVAADRLPRRALLIWTNLVMAGLLLTLAAVRSGDQVWLVYVVMLAYGMTFVLVDAAETGLLPAALPAEALGHVNGVRMSAQEGTKLVAPLAGAGLFALAGGPAVATLTASLLAMTAALYGLVRTTRRLVARGESAPHARRFSDGLRFLAANPRIRALVLTAAGAMLASGLGTASIYAVVDEALRRPAAFMGVLASIQGCGSIGGGVLAGRLLDRWGGRTFSAAGALLLAGGQLAQSSGWLPTVLAGSLAIGVGLPWTIISAMTAIQRHAPADVIGRVAGTANSLMFAPPALGIPVGAALLAVANFRVPLLVAAGGAIAVAVALLAGRHRSTRTDPPIGSARADSGTAPVAGRVSGGFRIPTEQLHR